MSFGIVCFSVSVIISNSLLGNVEGQSTQRRDSSTVFQALEDLTKAVESLQAKVDMQFDNLGTKVEMQGRILSNLEALLLKVEANVEIQATALKDLVAKEEWQEPTAQSPTNRTIIAREGDDVEMWCVVHGTPLPEIRWTRENGTLESNRVAVENNGKVLRIKTAQLNDEGTYVCVAANGVGTPATQSVRLEVYCEKQQCSRIIESDSGSLAIKTLSTGCLWVIKLQNKTGFRLEMDPPLTEPIFVIPEQSPSNSSVQSIQLSDAENASHEFHGKSLAILVPSGRERTTLSWTGLQLDSSRVSSSAKLVEEVEGSLEWESTGDQVDNIFWVFDHEFIEELNWTLNTASAARDQENPCENISFSVLQIKTDGNISEIHKTCDGSSEGSLQFEVSSKILVLLHIKSSESARSKLQVSWRNLDHGEPLQKKVDGIVAGAYVGAFVVPFNSGQTQSVASGRIYGLTFDWHSRKIYYLKREVGIIRSNLDGSESKILLSDSTGLFGMTIEPTSRNLYIGNRSSTTIRVCDNDAIKCSTIVNSSDLSSVEDIAFHRFKGLLFWSLWRGNLFRANLDGSNTTTILEGYKVGGIDVDELEDRLYWSSPNGIGSCDLNGQDIRMLPNVNNATSEVAINNDKVYYADYNTYKIHVILKSGTNENMIAQLASATWHMALFGPEVSNQPANPCKKSKCTHLCVLITRWSYRCMCPENQKLDLDGKTCSL